MDLLGDIGREDQLTSAREENTVLRAKVKELTVRVHELKAENEALRAEVEMYREDIHRVGGGEEGKEGGVPPAAADDVDDAVAAEEEDGVDFVTSGNGMYPSDPAATLPDMHGRSNPLCCSLHPDGSLLATGGADSNLRLCRWGAALAPGEGSARRAADESVTVPCGAPVICCAFARVRGPPVVAAGCMDGSVRLAHCGFGPDAPTADRALRPRESGNDDPAIRHSRYVRAVCWSPTEPVLASASADGTVQLTRVADVDAGSSTASIEIVKSLHFDGPVESMCYLNDGRALCCYVRGTPYLSYLDLRDDGCKLRRVSLNGGATGTGGFVDHVSFAVLSMSPSPRGGYLALATDASRNIVMEAGTDRIVRNLYGHKNDVYGNPKIAWSRNGQYLYGNSQDENCIYVWDVASASVVRRLDEGYGGHGGSVRDICSSVGTDTVASVSFDKTAKIWLSDV
jgi:WD40 repeat protein